MAFEVTPVSAAWHLFASHLSSFYSHPLTATIPFPSPEQAAESGGAGSAAERPRGPEFQGLRVAPGRLVEVLHRDGCGGGGLLCLGRDAPPSRTRALRPSAATTLFTVLSYSFAF